LVDVGEEVMERKKKKGRKRNQNRSQKKEKVLINEKSFFLFGDIIVFLDSC
jgi:hypothetical protein